MQGWRITNYDFNHVMRAPTSGRSPFLFLDPPYKLDSDDLYGVRGKDRMHRGFDHEGFHAAFHASVAPALLTYNSGFAAEYERHPVCLQWDLAYSMQSGADYKGKQGARGRSFS